nr:uncharacterized protein LOC109185919 [Ipomoea batatas]
MAHRNAAFCSAMLALEEASAAEGVIHCMSSSLNHLKKSIITSSVAHHLSFQSVARATLSHQTIKSQKKTVAMRQVPQVKRTRVEVKIAARSSNATALNFIKGDKQLL